MWRLGAWVAAGTVMACLMGCGAGPGSGCNYTYTLRVTPTSATADSTARSPGNQAKFNGSVIEGGTPYGGGQCVFPQVEPVTYSTWTSSDTVHVSLSSAHDSTNGLATCLGSTQGPVTVTATDGTGTAALSATAQLTCQ